MIKGTSTFSQNYNIPYQKHTAIEYINSGAFHLSFIYKMCFCNYFEELLLPDDSKNAESQSNLQ